MAFGKDKTKAQAAAPQPEPSTDLAVQERGGALSTDVLDMSQLEQDAGGGLENVRTADLMIPFYMILQSQSPECNEAHSDYVDGAKAGMIINSVTKEIIDGRDEGMIAIPCGFKSKINEWKPRGGTSTGASSGGGFAGTHPLDTPLLKQTQKNDKRQDALPNGNILMLTNDHYVIRRKADGTTEKGIIAMASSQLKKSRRWNSVMAAHKLQGSNGHFTPPTYTYAYKMTTVPEQNADGAWFGWELEEVGQVSAAEYREAGPWSKEIAAGTVVAAAQTLREEPAPHQREPGDETGTKDDEIPY